MTGVFRCIMMHRTSFSAFLSWPTCITAEDSDVSIHLSENTVASVDKTPLQELRVSHFQLAVRGIWRGLVGRMGYLVAEVGLSLS